MWRTENYNRFGKLIVLMGVVVLASTAAQADLNLSVSPLSGGNSLRFGRIDVPAVTNEEVRIRINSSEETQYQVFQRISQPFQNERGEALDTDAIVVSAQIGSNSAGTLELQTIEQLSFAQQLVYTSTNNGLSDAFTLTYQVNPEQITRAGNFSGQIVYSLRPLGRGPVDDRVLNAYLEVSGDLKVQQQSGSGADVVRLRSTGEGFHEDYFRISFSGNRGGPIRIYQEIERFPTDELNRDLGAETLLVFATGGENGELEMAQETFLNRRRRLIYSGTAAADEIWMQYRLNDQQDAMQTAGQFNGRLKYIIESTIANQSIPVDLDIEIAPVFELTTAYPPGGMTFTRLLPMSEPQFKEILVTINTNTGKPYLVSQNVRTALTSEKGEQFEPEFFTYKQEVQKNSPGRIEYPEFVPVPEGESILYYSDEFGSPAVFNVIYRLRPHQKMRAGDYKTSVRYSLEEK